MGTVLPDGTPGPESGNSIFMVEMDTESPLTLGEWQTSIMSLFSFLLCSLPQSFPASEGRLACTGASLFRAASCGPRLPPLAPSFS